MPSCDLLIIMGTSLAVQPFASLVDHVSKTTPRLLINREKCGQGSVWWTITFSWLIVLVSCWCWWPLRYCLIYCFVFPSLGKEIPKKRVFRNEQKHSQRHCFRFLRFLCFEAGSSKNQLDSFRLNSHAIWPDIIGSGPWSRIESLVWGKRLGWTKIGCGIF